MSKTLLIVLCALVFTGCVSKQSLVVDPGTVPAGSMVTRNGSEIALSGEAIEVGQLIPPVKLVDALSMKEVDLQSLKGNVLFLSIVPSIDTRVCERQSHYLGEEGDRLPASIKRITISRDTPFAQMRFAQDARLEDILYLSDYKDGSFGRSTGLLLDGPMLLARSVIIVDKAGVVRYMQVVPEITHLPDMNAAFEQAVKLDQEQ